MYYPKLDSIRCFAAFAVVFAHLLQIWTWDLTTFAMFPLGNAGVVVFFVLSGFLITMLLLDESEHVGIGTSLKNFYIRRTLRIFPIYYIFLIGTYAINNGDIRIGGIWPWIYLSNFFMFYNDQWLHNNSAIWSLAVEEQFYLVWPFIVLFLRHNTTALATTFVSVILLGVGMRGYLFLAGFSPSPQIEVFTFSNIDYLAAGALLALAQRHYGERLARYGVPALCGGLVFYWLTVQLSDGPPAVAAIYWTLGKFSVAVAAVGLIIYSLYSSQRYTLLHNPVTIHLGKISYAVYLFHNPFIARYQDIFGLVGLNPAAGVDYNPATNMIADPSAPLLPRLLAALMCLAMVIFIAECSYRLIERPLLKIKNRYRQG